MNERDRNTINGRQKLGIGLIYFSGLGLIGSSILKFIQPAKVVAYLAFLGYANDKYFFIAAIELVIAIMFLIRSTRPAGLLLLSSYLGGAISAHLASHPSIVGGPFLMFTANHPYLSTLPPDAFLLAAWFGTRLSPTEATPGAPK
jgi:hypothetical protein